VPYADRLSHIVLRLFTGDLFEGEREEDEWMFAANRLAPELALIVNISYGYAEIEAGRSSWQAVLTDAAGRALALWDENPELVEAGHVATAREAAPLPEPFDVGELIFDATGWVDPNLGLMVDLAELDTGDRAWREIVSQPDPSAEPVDGCPGCTGHALLLVETPPGYVDSLCPLHEAQHSSDQSTAAANGDGWYMTGRIMLASIPVPGNPIVTGLAARAEQVERGDPESSRAFLDWVASAFEGRADVFEQVVDVGYETDAIYQAIYDVRRLDPAAALKYGTQFADLANPRDRWLFEIGTLEALVDLGRQDEADLQVEAWPEQATSNSGLYMVAADHLISRGRFEDAIAPLRKMYGHAVMSGDQSDVTYALSHLARASSEVDLDSDTAEFRKQLLEVEATGVASLRPGRNDPCPCGSGRKAKRCCGRPINVVHG
jgi:hypothetical protein